MQQRQLQSLLSQTSWGSLEMKPKPVTKQNIKCKDFIFNSNSENKARHPLTLIPYHDSDLWIVDSHVLQSKDNYFGMFQTFKSHLVDC
jgi:hypothetical protein